MRPLYDARIEDLGDGDFVRVECIACGHDEMIPRIGLVVGLRLPASPIDARHGAPACRRSCRIGCCRPVEHGAAAQLTSLRTVLAGDCPRIGGAIYEQLID